MADFMILSPFWEPKVKKLAIISKKPLFSTSGSQKGPKNNMFGQLVKFNNLAKNGVPEVISFFSNSIFEL